MPHQRLKHGHPQLVGIIVDRPIGPVQSQGNGWIPARDIAGPGAALRPRIETRRRAQWLRNIASSLRPGAAGAGIQAGPAGPAAPRSGPPPPPRSTPPAPDAPAAAPRQEAPKPLPGARSSCSLLQAGGAARCCARQSSPAHLTPGKRPRTRKGAGD